MVTIMSWLLILLPWCLVYFIKDIFYLTVDELFAYVEGRSVTNDLMALAELRKKEWSGYKKVTVLIFTCACEKCIVVTIVMYIGIAAP